MQLVGVQKILVRDHHRMRALEVPVKLILSWDVSMVNLCLIQRSWDMGGNGLERGEALRVGTDRRLDRITSRGYIW